MHFARTSRRSTPSSLKKLAFSTIPPSMRPVTFASCRGLRSAFGMSGTDDGVHSYGAGDLPVIAGIRLSPETNWAGAVVR